MDRFNLEEAIMECWHTADDINLTIKPLLDGEVDSDDLANLLIGVRELHNLRMRKVMEIFEELVHSGSFDPDRESAS